MCKKILFIVNDPDYFLMHRLRVAVEAIANGYEVIVATGPGEGEDDIVASGLQHLRIPLSRAGVNPITELRLLFAIKALYRAIQPDLVHLVTIKPVLYGGLMARWMRVHGVVQAVTGMGYLFTSSNRRIGRWLAESLYRMALGHPNSRVIVQNIGDRDQLRDMGALRDGQDVLIRGSGVDTDRFTPVPLPEGEPLVILPARMLWHKGVGEFVTAAGILKRQGISARFALVGPFDAHNPSAVPLAQLQAWEAAGDIEWWGRQSDMPWVFSQASLVVLPSYREGMPKALLEAASAGRAIVTTDTLGCRDAVERERTGKLVPVGDFCSLANAITELLSDRPRLEMMGHYGREKAVAEFRIEQVVAAHMKIYRSLCR